MPRLEPAVHRPLIIAIPASDEGFSGHVVAMLRQRPELTAKAFEERLRRLYPRVALRERLLSGERPTWYVYRDGTWRPPSETRWWEQPGVPRVVMDDAGWIIEINASAAGLLQIEPSSTDPRHFTDFVAPGRLDDSVLLFDVVKGGRVIDATTVMRPTGGQVVAIELHGELAEQHRLLARFRLANDVDLPREASIGQRPEPEITALPRTDVAFTQYVREAYGRMPEPTPEGLALRVRRLYPHASVTFADGQWIAERNPEGSPSLDPEWWRDPTLARVRYDDKALILEANEAAEALLGQRMVGHFWQEFVTPGSTEQVTIMLEILEAVGAAESRFRMPRADGSLFEFDSYTTVDAGEFVTVMRPIGPAGTAPV